MKQRFFFFIIVGVVGLFFPFQKAGSAWNTPSCNPDEVGPTDVTCGVSAPLNVSDATQKKSGILEIQNTFRASKLVVNSNVGGTGNGSAEITASGSNTALTACNGSHCAYLAKDADLAALLQGAVSIQGATNIQGDTTIQGVTKIGTSSSPIGAGATALTIYESSQDRDALAINADGESVRGAQLNVSGQFSQGMIINIDGAESTGISLSAVEDYNDRQGITIDNFENGMYINNADTGINVNGGYRAISAASSTGDVGYFDSFGVGRAGVFMANSVNPSVFLKNFGTGIGLSLQSASGLGISAESSSNHAIYGLSQAGGTYYGGGFCGSGVSNCAYLGGAAYAASFQGRVNHTASIATYPLYKLTNTNTSANPGFGLRAITMSGSFTEKTPLQGTALDGQAKNGYGVHGYSLNNEGILGESQNNAGVSGKAEANGQSGVYGEFISTTNSGYGVYGKSQNGTGVKADSTTGTALQATALNGTGLSASGTVNAAEFVGNTTTSGRATAAQFLQTQRLKSPLSGTAITEDSARIGIVTTGFKNMVFDGGEIWTLINKTATETHLYRLGGSDMALSRDVTLTWATAGSTSELVQAANIGVRGVYFWNPAGEVYFWGRSSANPELLTQGSNQKITNTTSGVDTGDRVYIGTGNNAGVYYSTTLQDKNAASFSTIGNSLNTWGNIVDMLQDNSQQAYALNYIAGASAVSSVVRINSVTNQVDKIYNLPAGQRPYYMEFDGKYIWVTLQSTAYDSIARVDIVSGQVQEFYLTSDGTAGGTVQCSDPQGIAFDGVYVWLSCVGNNKLVRLSGDSGLLVKFDSSLYSLSVTGGSPMNNILFDGTYFWTSIANNTIHKYFSGQGSGSYSEPFFHRGVNMISTSGNVYCLRIIDNGDGTGSLLVESRGNSCSSVGVQ